MADALQCRLISPEKKLVEAPVRFASIPAWDGSLGIYPMHAPLVTKLGVGELRLDVADTEHGRGGSRSFLVEGGFLQVVGDSLTILAELAIPAEKLSEQDAEAELREAEARQTPEGASPREREQIQADRERARKKLELARKSKGKGI